MAVHEGHFPIAYALFKNGGDVADSYIEGMKKYGRPDYSSSPMYSAARSEKVEMLKLLLSDSERFVKPGWRLRQLCSAQRVLGALLDRNPQGVLSFWYRPAWTLMPLGLKEYVQYIGLRLLRIPKW